MNTAVSTKLAALALALCANSALLGTTAYLFNAHAMVTLPIAAVAQRPVNADQVA